MVLEAIGVQSINRQVLKIAFRQIVELKILFFGNPQQLLITELIRRVQIIVVVVIAFLLQIVGCQFDHPFDSS